MASHQEIKRGDRFTKSPLTENKVSGTRTVWEVDRLFKAPPMPPHALLVDVKDRKRQISVAISALQRADGHGNLAFSIFDIDQQRMWRHRWRLEQPINLPHGPGARNLILGERRLRKTVSSLNFLMACHLHSRVRFQIVFAA